MNLLALHNNYFSKKKKEVLTSIFPVFAVEVGIDKDDSLEKLPYNNFIPYFIPYFVKSNN